MILAGDIGGTNTRLAIFDDNLKPIVALQKFPTGDGTALEGNIAKVLAQAPGPVERGCLAIAGPVIEGVCRSTNIKRELFTEVDIAKSVGLKKLTLINDLVANASGVELLEENEQITLIEGEKHNGTRAIVSPGTGLGEAILFHDGHVHRAMPSEGGHCRFAPTTPDEFGVAQYLQKIKGDSIVEHVISGQGIENIFNYFLSTGRKPADKVAADVAAAGPGRSAAVVAAAAIHSSCPLCVDVMKLFVHALAVECANMAVKTFAIGGVYVGGGIPPKILPLIQNDGFNKAFLAHVTMSKFLAKIPVRVILNDDTALEGAALYGLRFG